MSEPREGMAMGQPRRPPRPASRRPDLRRLRDVSTLALAAYFLLGIVSQKLIPGVDEVIPFFSWSLFSKVPASASRYVVLIEEQDGRRFAPAPDFLHAPESVVRGDRHLADKVIQKLGRHHERGASAAAERQRELLERSFLRGEVRYRLLHGSYDPLERWRTGEVRESRTIATFVRRAGGDGR